MGKLNFRIYALIVNNTYNLLILQQIKNLDFIYVADCKLCSQTNLIHISKNRGYFIYNRPEGPKGSQTVLNVPERKRCNLGRRL